MARVVNVIRRGREVSRWSVSEIRSLYRDENDLFRTVIKRIYEEFDAEREQWDLRRIEFIYRGSGAPGALRQSRGGCRTAAWVAYPAGVGIYIARFGSTSGSRCRKTVYDHESEVGISSDEKQIGRGIRRYHGFIAIGARVENRVG